jgi:hypothetical protein
MNWTWKRIVELNKIICEASNQPHAIRTIPIWLEKEPIDIIDLPKDIAENHYFIEGNKRTATCLAVCLALEGV